MRWARAPLVLAAAAIGVSACGGDDDEGAGSGPAPRLAVDERRGTVDGVGLGDGEGRIEQALGPGVSGATEEFPDEVDEDLPLEIKAGDLTSPIVRLVRMRGPESALRYRGASFFLIADQVIDIWVTGDQARTRRGLGPGDPIERAGERYPELECGETDVGRTEEILEPACWGKLGATHIWIGGDPINNLQLLEPAVRANATGAA